MTFSVKYLNAERHGPKKRAWQGEAGTVTQAVSFSSVVLWGTGPFPNGAAEEVGRAVFGLHAQRCFCLCCPRASRASGDTWPPCPCTTASTSSGATTAAPGSAPWSAWITPQMRMASGTPWLP